MRRFVTAWSMVAALAALAASADEAPTGGESRKGADVKAVIELSQQFIYAGDPFPARISVGNDGEKTASNPMKSGILKGLRVKRVDGEALDATGTARAQEPARPDELAPGTFYGMIVDLAELFPEIRVPGTYVISWSAAGLEANAIVARVIPRYDPSKQYRATVRTSEGEFEIDFFEDSSPVAVKAFIDLANSGFYEGTFFSQVKADLFVVGGDPVGDGSGQAPIRFPAELPAIPTVRGTVLMRPVSAAPPANSSQFIILLQAEPSWTGQATVLGQVSSGIETVEKISRLPTTERTTQPYFKPLKDLTIDGIEVKEKAAAPPAKPADPSSP